MVEIAGTIAGILGVVGVVLNNHKLIWCFPVWILSNVITAVLHINAGLYALFARDCVFTALAIQGWMLWRAR